MRKRIFILLLCIISACSFLAGCKSNPTNIYEAYGEFYQEFYNSHADRSSEIAKIDCGGRILFDAENNPLLAICDITEMSEEAGIVSDIYIYEYSNGKVRELAKKTGVISDDNGVFIDSVNGVVTMRVCDHILNNDDDDTIYILGEDGFKEEVSVPVYHDDMISLEKANMYIDFWYDTYEFADTFYYAFFDSSRYLYTINGSSFNTLLSKLAVINPGTQLELKMVYTEFFKDEDIYEESNFVYVDDKQFYIYNSSEEKLFYLGNFDIEVGEETPEDVPDEIEGVKIELSGYYIKELLGSIKVNDIEKFECKDNIVFIQTVQGVSLEVSSVYTYPDSEDYIKTTDWNIYIEEEKTSIESSYDAVKKYIDAGLAEDILINCDEISAAEVFAADVSISLADKESFFSLMDEDERQQYLDEDEKQQYLDEDEKQQYLDEDEKQQYLDEDERQQYLDEDEKQQYIIENEVIPAYETYISEKYGDGEYNVYNLIYIDKDNIPELLFDNSADGSGTEVLCYIDGEVYSTPAWCRGFEFDYVPKENKIFFGGALYDEFSETVGYLENGAIVEEHSYSFKLDETADENGPFEIDGVQCSKEEFDLFIDKYFKNNNIENGWETYSSIQEAYENLKEADS